MRTIRTFGLVIMGLCAWSSAVAQIPVGKKPQGPILLTHGVLHLGTGAVLEDGSLTFADGKITGVYPAGSTPDAGAHQVIDLAGAHVYPGLILPNSDVGLSEVEAVRATVDHSETGDLNPNIRSLIAYNTDSELIPTMRRNGVLLAHVNPRGGLVSGTSSVMALDGWNWEDAAYATDLGVHVTWPGLMKNDFNFQTQRRTWKRDENYEKNTRLIEQLLAEGRTYSDTTKPVNLKLKSLTGLYTGTQILFLHADHSRTIVDGILAAKRHGIKRVVVVGGADALSVADFLVTHQVPVILDTLHRLPSAEDSDVNSVYKLPAALKKAGVQFCIGYDSTMSARNLPFIAGTAAAWGLSKEEALGTVTLDTAKILGIDKRTGSLEVGKDANLFVSKGDALDMRTNQLTLLFIRGNEVPLDGRQEQLYQHFTR